MRTYFLTVGLGSFLMLSGCGGGGGGAGGNNPNPNPTPQPQTATGRFIDTVVEGLEYSSGNQSGITSDSGSFTYEVGEDVTFTVGSVEIGTVAGADLITPVDLVGGDSDTVEVQNIVRFLLMLDSDGDNSNGITISSEVRGIAENWLQPDFTTDLLDGELASITADVMAIDNRLPVLPDALEAKNHLEATLSCLASGIFAGTFSGTDEGTFVLWVQHQRYDPFVFGDTDSRVGVTSALVYSSAEDVVLGVAPQQGLSFNSDKQFVSGVVSNGASFSGELADYITLANGSWSNGLTGDSGTFTGERLAGGEGAVYRLSGFINIPGFDFTPDGSGLIGLDIAADNSVTGVMVTLRGDIMDLMGTLTGNQIAVSGGEHSFSLTFDPDGTDPSNDVALGSVAGFTGSWVSNMGTGDVIGTSCQPD